MHPTDCPDWEYRRHPNTSATLPQRVANLLISLRTGTLAPRGLCADTRPTHALLFAGLTPQSCAYYAGNYRGSPHRCLQYYPVGVPADPRVGIAPTQVPNAMRRFHSDLSSALGVLDRTHQIPNAQISRELKLFYTVVVCARVFVDLLTIHPYANGNGHIARLLIWSILGTFGWWPNRWPVEPRTKDPAYLTAILAYRNGNPQIMEQFILSCIAAAPP